MRSVNEVCETGLVSVIVPAFNAALLIGETLESILTQSYANIEVIVVDDGSTDDTTSLVKGSFPGVKLVYQANSGGCSSPRNRGLKDATGEFVTFFDADDIMAAEKLETQVRFLRGHDDCLAVLMDYKNFDSKGTHYDQHFSTCSLLGQERIRQGDMCEFVLEPRVARSILVNENFSIASSPLFRKSAFKQIDAFDERLLASEDFDLIYRLAMISGLGIICEVGFFRRMHLGNMSNRSEHVLQHKITSRTKLFSIEEDEHCRRELRKFVAYRHREAVELYFRLEPKKAARHFLAATRARHPLDIDLAKAFVKCGIGFARSFRGG